MKEYIIQTKDEDSDVPIGSRDVHMQGSRTPVIAKMPMLTPGINKRQIKALCPESPIQQNLPPAIMQFNTIYSQNPRSNIGTPMVPKNFLKSPLTTNTFMTPRTVQLYAFGESASGDLDKIFSKQD